MKNFAIAFALTALVGAAPAAAADTGCMLQPMGSAALTMLADGGVSVPVTIAGAPEAMTLELGVGDSAVSESFADSLKLARTTLPQHIAVRYRDALVGAEVRLPQFQFGAMTGSQVAVLLLPEGSPLPAGVVGVLGATIAGNADLEIDFAAGKVNLFSPQHCPGAVVYWTDTAAVVPFVLDELHRPVFHMELDGKPVSVAFRAGGKGQMRLSVARALFGAAPAGFATLAVGGITLRNPAIAIVDDYHDACSSAAKPLDCASRTDLEIGLSQLKGLHLFFAFGEKKLYATAADAHK